MGHFSPYPMDMSFIINHEHVYHIPFHSLWLPLSLSRRATWSEKTDWNIDVCCERVSHACTWLCMRDANWKWLFWCGKTHGFIIICCYNCHTHNRRIIRNYSIYFMRASASFSRCSVAFWQAAQQTENCIKRLLLLKRLPNDEKGKMCTSESFKSFRTFSVLLVLARRSAIAVVVCVVDWN